MGDSKIFEDLIEIMEAMSESELGFHMFVGIHPDIGDLAPFHPIFIVLDKIVEHLGIVMAKMQLSVL